MLSRADSDSRWISATLAKCLHFKTYFICGYKTSRKERGRVSMGWGVGVGHNDHFVSSQKLLDASVRSAHSVFKKSPNTLADTWRNCQKNWHEARSSLSLGRLVQNIVCLLRLVAEPWTMSRLCGRFKFRKYLGPPSYNDNTRHYKNFLLSHAILSIYQKVYNILASRFIIIFLPM